MPLYALTCAGEGPNEDRTGYLPRLVPLSQIPGRISVTCRLSARAKSAGTALLPHEVSPWGLRPWGRRFRRWGSPALIGGLVRNALSIPCPGVRLRGVERRFKAQRIPMDWVELKGRTQMRYRRAPSPGPLAILRPAGARGSRGHRGRDGPSWRSGRRRRLNEAGAFLRR